MWSHWRPHVAMMWWCWTISPQGIAPQLRMARRARGERPGRQPLDADKIAAAIKLVKAGLSPTTAARGLGLGRSTVYRELNRGGTTRLSKPA